MREVASETVVARRACPVVLVPSSHRAILAAGERVVVLQRLGTSFTVRVGHGMLARVAKADADALGIAVPGGDEHGEHGVGEDAAGGPETQAPGRDSGGEHVLDVEVVLDRLRSVYDPEIPVNVVDLGLIYGCEIHPTYSGGYRVAVWMSMTAPGCGMGDILRAEAPERILEIPGVEEAAV